MDAGKRVKTLFRLCLEIAGSEYALAIITSGSKRQSEEFEQMLRDYKKKLYATNPYVYIPLFEGCIKTNALFVAYVRDDLLWVEVEGYKKETLKKYYKKYPHLFVQIEKKLYFVETKGIILENLFWKCVSLAGGENRLAVALSKGDKKEYENHRAVFKRLKFKHRRVYKKYSSLFSEFLEKNRSLFEISEAVA